MFVAILIISLLAALMLIALVGVARKAPESYEDKGGFHLGKEPDLPAGGH